MRIRVLFALVAGSTLATSAFALFHPHFPKRVEMSLGFGDDAPTIAVSHITASFDKDGFEQMPAGGAWHLANGHLETTADVKIGGHEIDAGTYRLLARKRSDEKWELVLDPKDAQFSREISEGAMALATKFEKEGAPKEHLLIDLRPSGEKEATVLHLVVQFDQWSATSLIEIE